MDRRPAQDSQPAAAKPAARRFEAVAADRDRTYPMLAPAAAVAATSDQDAQDIQPCAGHVNV
ncbi:MAG TPA: hypothetical protein VFT50_07750 [Baekduia sp.]|nr:hypothetical protein [Baekduia sp.]